MYGAKNQSLLLLHSFNYEQPPLGSQQASLFNFFNNVGEKKNTSTTDTHNIARAKPDSVKTSKGFNLLSTLNSDHTNTKDIFSGDAYTHINELMNNWTESRNRISSSRIEKISTRKLLDFNSNAAFEDNLRKPSLVTETDLDSMIRPSVYHSTSNSEKLFYGGKQSMRAVTVVIEDRSRPPMHLIVTRRVPNVSHYRNPFRLISNYGLDIDIDSDDEWEELFAADDVSENGGSDNEEEEEEAEDDKDEFFVPDGQFQAEEEVDDAEVALISAQQDNNNLTSDAAPNNKPLVLGPADFEKIRDKFEGEDVTWFRIPSLAESGYNAPYCPSSGPVQSISKGEEFVFEFLSSGYDELSRNEKNSIADWIGTRSQILRLGDIDSCCLLASAKELQRQKQKEDREEREKRREEERKKREEENLKRKEEKERELKLKKEEKEKEKEDARRKKEEENKKAKEESKMKAAELKAAKQKLMEERQRDRDLKELENVPLARLFKTRNFRRNSLDNNGGENNKEEEDDDGESENECDENINSTSVCKNIGHGTKKENENTEQIVIVEGCKLEENDTHLLKTE